MLLKCFSINQCQIVALPSTPPKSAFSVTKLSLLRLLSMLKIQRSFSLLIRFTQFKFFFFFFLFPITKTTSFHKYVHALMNGFKLSILEVSNSIKRQQKINKRVSNFHQIRILDLKITYTPFFKHTHTHTHTKNGYKNIH